MPGLGVPVPVRLDEASVAVGKTLAQLNLRGITGASVLAIARGEGGVIVPMASEVLRSGDVLALAGTRDAIAAATDLLKDPAPGGEQEPATPAPGDFH
jgi:CPA2 family monovalent cation:H+ antiporter-2